MARRKPGPSAEVAQPKPVDKGDEIRLASLEVTSLNAQQLSCDQTTDAELVRENAISVLETSDRIVKLRLTERLFFRPEGPFKLDLDVTGTYVYPRPVKEEDIQPQSENLSAPLLAYSSFIISFITQQFGGVPIVLPPALS
ncbi:MAG: hypothetical protein HPY52_15940 [Firmicutes bacterium]|nr:hypothetical protein [Bacillota bacterium]